MFLKKFFTAIVAAVLLATSTCLAAKSEIIDVEIVTPEINFRGDVTFARYFTWPQSDLKMDIYFHDGKEKSPAVIFVPGG